MIRMYESNPRAEELWDTLLRDNEEASWYKHYVGPVRQEDFVDGRIEIFYDRISRRYTGFGQLSLDLALRDLVVTRRPRNQQLELL